MSGTYDFTTGLLTSFTNANATQQASGNTPGDAAHTTIYGYDLMWRMTSATFPPDPANNNAQAQTKFNYPVPITLPFAVTKTRYVTPGVPDSLTTTFDGMGRAYKTQHALPNGTATVDTIYDGLDHVVSVSNPYFSTSDPTYGITTTYYDGLERVTQVAPPDGTLLPSGAAVTQCLANNTCTDYSNFPAVTVTDQVGNPRRSITDALGRLIEVDEPGAPSPATPASGTLTIGGALRSQSSVGAGPGTATVTIGGPGSQSTCCDGNGDTIWDQGMVSITVNGFTVQTGFISGSPCCTQFITQYLVNAINQDNPYVTGSCPGGSCVDTIVLTAKSNGPNYSLSAASTYDSTDFGQASFTATASGASLTGGSAGATVKDSGTVSVSVGSFTASACYGPSGSCTVLPGCPSGDSSPAQAACFLASTANSNGLNRSGFAGDCERSGQWNHYFHLQHRWRCGKQCRRNLNLEPGERVPVSRRFFQRKHHAGKWRKRLLCKPVSSFRDDVPVRPARRSSLCPPERLRHQRRCCVLGKRALGMAATELRLQLSYRVVDGTESRVGRSATATMPTATCCKRPRPRQTQPQDQPPPRPSATAMTR